MLSKQERRKHEREVRRRMVEAVKGYAREHGLSEAQILEIVKELMINPEALET